MSSKKPTTDLSKWLLKPEVMQLLGISQRSVERLQETKQLETGRRKVPGARPLVVYNPDHVAQLKAAQLEQVAAAERAGRVNDFNERQKDTMRAAADVAGPRVFISLDDSAREFAERILNELQLMRAVKERLILTIREANELGCRPRVLRTLIREGHLRNYGTGRTPRVSKRELMALIDNPPEAMLLLPEEPPAPPISGVLKASTRRALTGR